MPKIDGVKLTDEHIGRAVTYTGNRSHGGEDEYGFITSFNRSNVFVRYKGNTSQATTPTDLEFQNT